MTIEERADNSANESTIHKMSDSWYIHRYGYIKGAIEQKAIDDKEFLSESLKMLKEEREIVKRETIDKACGILWDMCLTERQEYKTYKDVIDHLRKKLEE